MAHVTIIYFSQNGTTRQLASAIEHGVTATEGVTCQSYSIEGSVIVEGRFVDKACLELVDGSDAVIFGSPTYMGGPAAQFKAFADASSDRWDEQQWAGKVAAGFTVGANPGGDQLCTLQYLSVLAGQHGMLWVGLDMPCNTEARKRNIQGTQLGLSVCTVDDSIQKADTLTGEYLGTRVAELVWRMCASQD